MRPHAARHRKAFTLLELIVVVVVLAVLAAIAIVGYSRVIDRTEWASLETTAQSMDRQYQALLASDPDQDPEELAMLVIADMPSAAAQPQMAQIVVAADPLPVAAYVGPGDAASGDPSIEVERYGKTVCLTLPESEGESVDGRVNRGDCTTLPPTTTTTVLDGDFPITATPGNAQITLTFADQGAVDYTGACWTAAMGEANAVTAAAVASSPIVVTGLENYVLHTCRVTHATATSGTATATPQGVPAAPVGPTPVGPIPNGTNILITPEPGDCADCVTVPANDPLLVADGLWDISSLYSEHSGDHRLYAVDRGNARVITVVDNGTTASTATALAFGNPSNTAAVTFTEPSGLGYGAHPARTTNSSVTMMSVVYLTDYATGDVWMLDVNAYRAYQVASGINAPTGVAWSACTDSTTGAQALVSGASQCLYVAGADGITRVSLLSDVDANDSTQPADVAPASHAILSAVAAKKIATATNLYSTEGAATIGRGYTSTPAVTSTGTNATGVTHIPASLTGTTDLVVVADGATHTISTFNPAAPGTQTLIAGSGSAGYVDGTGTAARFDTPQAVHFHGNWPFVYVADTGNGAIRKVNILTGQVTTVLGSTTPPAGTAYPFTGACQSVVVPVGATSVTADLFGAQGATGHAAGGLGGRIRATAPVTAGETLLLCVGGSNGFNGGGSSSGRTGGGATDLRRDSLDGTNGNVTTSMDDRLLVAGGGGGGAFGLRQTCSAAAIGGAGSGGAGAEHAQHAQLGGQAPVTGYMGLGGYNTGTASFAADGTVGRGGAGQTTGYTSWGMPYRCYGGGGGGGYVGGGGGGASTGTGGGGGGGTGFAHASATGTSSWTGTQIGNGIAYLDFNGPAATTVQTADDRPDHGALQCVSGVQRVRVPAGVTTAAADISGAQGSGADGGFGGRIAANLTGLTPGEVLYVTVGCSSGYNGGASGGNPGGGATDIRSDSVDSALDVGLQASFGPADRLLVAGGGGGSAAGNRSACGSGSSRAGGTGSGGDGATHATNVSLGGQAPITGFGGLGGYNGSSTQFAADGTATGGGVGASISWTSFGLGKSCTGGGGGGGYLGGGGGGALNSPESAGGGGGGTGFAHTTTEFVSTWTGTQAGNGTATINFDAAYTATTATAADVPLSWEVQCASSFLSGPMTRIRVPAGVTTATVDMAGSVGAGNGGHGGQLAGPLTDLTPGEILQARAGCSTGFNGGATGGNSGGGATDLRRNGSLAATDLMALADRIAVAGGGGGASSNSARGGDGSGADDTGTGSGTTDLGLTPLGGTGGTYVAGGTGGVSPRPSGSPTPGNNGTLGLGGSGGYDSGTSWGLGTSTTGGGGGGGYYGGGGGGAFWSGTGSFRVSGGGGGGSGYTGSEAAGMTSTAGANSGQGYLNIEFTLP